MVLVDGDDDAPVANGMSFSGTEDSASSFILNYSDPENDLASSCALSNIVDGTEGTTCSCDGAGVCTANIMPNPDFNGTLTFDFTVTANGLTSNISGSNINITAVNDAPLFVSTIADQFINENASTGAQPFDIQDVDNALTCTGNITASSDNQALISDAAITFAGTYPNCTVTAVPTANANGQANITLTLDDGIAQVTDTFLVDVSAINDPPTISDVADQTFLEDSTSGPIGFTISDPDNVLSCDGASVSATSDNTAVIPVGNIAFGGAAPNCTVSFSAPADVFGTATVTITVSDGTLTVQDTVLITVSAVDDAPVFISPVADQVISENTDTGVLAFQIQDIDSALTCGASITGTSDNQALIPDASITIAGTSPNCTVSAIPAANANGQANITLNLDDGTTQVFDTFLVDVMAVNDPPIISNIADITFDEDSSSGAMAFTISDPDNALFCDGTYLSATSSDTTVIPVGNIAFGGAAPNCTVSFSAPPDVFGTATVTITVSDGTLAAQDTVLITVNAIDDEPVVSGFVISPDLDVGVERILNIDFGTQYTDVEGNMATSCGLDTFSGAAVTETTACSCAAGNCTVGITASGSGAGSFNYFVMANGLSSTNVVAVTFNAVATPPNDPTAPYLSTPATSPNFDTSPAIGVYGVNPGHELHVYTNSDCSAPTGDFVTAASDPEILTLSALAEGSYDFYFKVRDPGNNLWSNCTSVFVSYEVDLTAPAQPSVLSLNSPASNPSFDDYPTILINGLTDGDEIHGYADGSCSTPAGNPVIASGGQVLFTSDQLTTDNIYNFYFKAKDPAGNWSACSSNYITYEFDTTAPSTPATFSLSNPLSSPGNNDYPSILISGVANGDEIHGYSNPGCTTSAGSFTVASAGSATFNSNQLVGDGTYYFYFKAKDPAGNWSTCSSGNVQYELDRVAPTVTMGPDIITADPDIPAVSSSDNIGIASYTWSAITGPGVITFSDATIEIPSISASADGLYSLQLIVTDIAGNQTTGGISFTWDTTPPNIVSASIDAGQNSGFSSNPGIDVTLDVAPDADIVRLFDQPGCAGADMGTNTLTFNGEVLYFGSGAFQEGLNNFSIWAEDQAGNISSCLDLNPYELERSEIYLTYSYGNGTTFFLDEVSLVDNNWAYLPKFSQSIYKYGAAEVNIGTSGYPDFFYLFAYEDFAGSNSGVKMYDEFAAGFTASDPLGETTPTDPGFLPHVSSAVGSDNVMHAVSVYESNNGDHTLHYITSDLTDTNLTPPYLDNFTLPTGQQVKAISVAIDSDDLPIRAVSIYDPGIPDDFINVEKWNGTSWVAIGLTTIDSNCDANSHPQIVVDANGDLQMIYLCKVAASTNCAAFHFNEGTGVHTNLGLISSSCSWPLGPSFRPSIALEADRLTPQFAFRRAESFDLVYIDGLGSSTILSTADAFFDQMDEGWVDLQIDLHNQPYIFFKENLDASTDQIHVVRYLGSGNGWFKQAIVGSSANNGLINHVGRARIAGVKGRNNYFLTPPP